MTVTVKLMTAGAARGAVIWRLIYGGMKRTVHMAVGSGGTSVARIFQATVDGRTGPKKTAGPPVVGPPWAVGMAVRQPQVSECFKCQKQGHGKNECPYGGALGRLGCFTCAWKGHISRDCPWRVWLDVQTTGGIKDKGKMGHGPEERSMGPNKRGWIEKTKDILDYSSSVEETIREMETAGGPSGVRF